MPAVFTSLPNALNRLVQAGLAVPYSRVRLHRVEAAARKSGATLADLEATYKRIRLAAKELEEDYEI